MAGDLRNKRNWLLDQLSYAPTLTHAYDNPMSCVLIWSIHRINTVSREVTLQDNVCIMNTNINHKLALRIRELRKKCGYTQEKLAELSGVDYKHIQLLEGKHPSSSKIDTLEKLAKAFKISLSNFIDFK